MTEGLVVLFIVIYLVVSIQLLAAGITHQSSSPRITFACSLFWPIILPVIVTCYLYKVLVTNKWC